MSENLSQARIALFGNFGRGNFGNDVTFQAVLLSLRHLAKDAEFLCICTGPEVIAATYNITTVPTSYYVAKPWKLHNPLARFARKLLVGIPSELYRWLKAFKTLRGMHALIIPGTGLLTDAYGLFDWGPYGLLKWTLTARLRRCKVFFVSVGAGPLEASVSRFLVKKALSLAEFRSYRDESSQQCLIEIGFDAQNDPVYPDLAYSLPENVMRRHDDERYRGQPGRPVVGVGVMGHAGTYGVGRPTDTEYVAYLESLAGFAEWLLAHGYNVRLLIGDAGDVPATQQFKALLKETSEKWGDARIIDEPAASVDDLLSQLAATDVAVATRFHNVLLSLLLNKPTIAISFHHKCSSLMSQMGLSDYCQDIRNLKTETLIERFRGLQKSGDRLRQMITEKVESCREALDEQYDVIFSKMHLDESRVVPAPADNQYHSNTNVLL